MATTTLADIAPKTKPALCDCGAPVQTLTRPDGTCFSLRQCDACQTKASAINSRREFETYLHTTHIPQEFWSYDTDHATEAGKLHILKWTIQHTDEWIMLCGPSRAGKSRALGRAAVIEAWKRGPDKRPSILWIDCATWLTGLNSREAQVKNVARDLRNQAYSASLLILDDFGQEVLTDETRAFLFSLINHRHQHRQRTWISTNTNTDEFNAHLGPFRAEQIRLRILERGTRYFWDGTLWREESKRFPPPATEFWWQDLDN